MECGNLSVLRLQEQSSDRSPPEHEFETSRVPMQGLSQMRWYQRMHLYNSLKCAAELAQVQLVRSSVPKMLTRAWRHLESGWAHLPESMSTEHARSKASMADLKSRGAELSN